MIVTNTTIVMKILTPSIEINWLANEEKNIYTQKAYLGKSANTKGWEEITEEEMQRRQAEKYAILYPEIEVTEEITTEEIPEE